MGDATNTFNLVPKRTWRSGFGATPAQPTPAQPTGPAFNLATPYQAAAQRSSFKMPAAGPVQPNIPAGTYGLGTPMSRPAPLANGGLIQPPPAPKVTMAEAIYQGRRIAPQVGRAGSIAPPAASSPKPSMAQAIYQGRTIDPRFARAPAVPTPAPAATAAIPGATGQQAWGALMQPSPPSGQQAWNALHPAAPPSAPSASARVAAPAIPAGGTPGVAARASLGGRLGGVGGFAKSFGKSMISGVPLGIFSMAGGNPDEGFMHLGGEGNFAQGTGRIASTLGHLVSGERQPGDITFDDFANAVTHHTWAGDLHQAIMKGGQTVGDLASKPDARRDFGRGLSVLGDRLSGAAPPPQQQAANASPNISTDLAQHMHNTMGADQLNSVYEKMGIGGAHPVQATRQAEASLSAAAPKSADSPVVQQGVGQSQAPPNPSLGHASLDGDQAWRQMNQAMYALAPFPFEHGDQIAGLANAMANYRDSFGRHDVGMLGARAEMEKATNPLGGYMNPVGIRVLAGQAQDPNLIGVHEAMSGASPSHSGLPGYTQVKHPEFSPLLGNKESSLDQFRALYEQSKGRFRAGDQQLSELQNYVNRILQSRFSPEEQEAASRPGWFGLGGQDAARTRAFLGELRGGVR